MDPRVLNFIKRHRISCLTTMLTDRQPHSATLHYCFDEKTKTFYFLTEESSRKMQELSGGSSKSSLVIGFSEEEWVTLQLEGEIEETFDDERNKAIETFRKKFDNDVSKLKDENVFLKFTPSWWRYTELKREPPVIISS